MKKMKKASRAYKTGESGKTYYSREQEAAARSMFLQNKYWKEYYEGAPGPECKAYILFEFCFFLYGSGGGEAFLKCRENMEKQLDYYDLEWLYRHCGNNPKKARLRKLMADAGHGKRRSCT